MADKAHAQTDKLLEEMERHLSAIFFRANDEIRRKAEAYFTRFDAQDKKKRDQLSAGKITKKEYQDWRQGKIMYGKRFKAMRDDLVERLFHTNQIAVAYINGELPGVYVLNYNALPEMADLGGYSFTLADEDTIRHLAASDDTLLPYKYIDGQKDVRWNTRRVNAEILQGILQGDTMQDIAKRLGRVTEMNRASAIRNARTCVTGAENRGRMDSFQDAEDAGVIIEKVWIATEDGRTRHSHRLLDGQRVAYKSPFRSELGPIMYPGDPEADPANVYNCRCTLSPKVIGFKKV